MIIVNDSISRFLLTSCQFYIQSHFILFFKKEDKIKSTIFALKQTTTATISILNMPQMIVTFSLSPSLLPIALSLLLLKLSLLWLLLLLLVLLNLNCCHWLLSRSTQKQVRCSNMLGTGWIWEAQLFNGASSLFI